MKADKRGEEVGALLQTPRSFLSAAALAKVDPKPFSVTLLIFDKRSKMKIGL
jgi:hypothetical protein